MIALWVAIASCALDQPACAQTASSTRASSAAPEPVPNAQRELDATGFLLAARRVQIGPFFSAYGLTDWLNIGTQPSLWLLAPLLGGFSANIDLKAGLPIGSLVHVALEVNPIWINVDYNKAARRALLVPITLAASIDPLPRQTYSLAFRFLDAEGKAEGALSSQSIAGAAVTRVAQVIGQAEYRFNGTLALYLQGTIQPWQQDLHVKASDRLDARTTVMLEGEASPVNQALPWTLLLGTHLTFGLFHMRIAAGYGNITVPRLGIAIRTYRGPLGDLDLYVRF